MGSLVLYAILGRLSTGAVAATAALTNGLRIEAILYLPVYALNMITAVLVAQALGAAHPDEAERIGWRVAKTAAVLLAAMALPVFVFSMEVAGTITPDPLVREMTHVYLRFNMISQPFMALGVCLAGALEGAGDTRGTMKVVLATLWGFRLPVAAVLALVTPLAANGVWIAMVVSMILQCVAISRRYQRGRWKEIALFTSGGSEALG
jgi:MATE family multidrug resistance protein